MNILQIGTTDKIGGAAVISWKIKKALELLGHKTSMFVAFKYSNDLNVLNIKRTTHKLLCFLFSNDIDLFRTNWIIKTKEFIDADIIHLHNLHGWFFNLKTIKEMSKLKPIIWTLHDMWAITSHCAHSFEGGLENGFYQCQSLNSYPRIAWHNEKYLCYRKKIIYDNSDFEIVVPSMWLKNKVENSLLKEKNIHLIYNGVDTKVFRSMDKQTIRKDLNISLVKKIILCFSDKIKNNEYKGSEYINKILEKFRNNKSVHFICIGGSANSDFEKNSNITYIPNITDVNLLAKYYASSDIFLYPSIADSFGLVVAESMACGTPVLTFKVGGIPEIVDHKINGYVAKYKDEDDLINGLNYILDLSNIETELMSESAISKIRNNFTEDMMIEKYIELYNSLIKR